MWIQSEAPLKITRLTDAPLNSGFYFVKSSPRTIAAFAEIVGHAAQRPNKSEQPSFRHVLCGPGTTHIGLDICHQPRTGLTVRVLPILKFPNGRSTIPVTEGAVIAHANFLAGKEKKLARIHERGWWTLDALGHCNDTAPVSIFAPPPSPPG